MPLNLFYTMVQKSQKWPKTQIKGGGPALNQPTNFFSSFVHQRQGWVPSYQGCHREETSDVSSENDPTLTRHCATFSQVTSIFYFTSAICMSLRTFVQSLRKIYLIFLPRLRYPFYRFQSVKSLCIPHVTRRSGSISPLFTTSLLWNSLPSALRSPLFLLTHLDNNWWNI